MACRPLRAAFCLVVLVASAALWAHEAMAAELSSTSHPSTFTYNLLTGTCTKTPSGTCNGLATHAVCGKDLTPAQIAQNDAALRSFNAEAQRHTRPFEPGYGGGNYVPGPSADGFPWTSARDAYPDAHRDNLIVLEIPACDRLQYSWNSFTMLIRNIKVIGAGSDVTFLQNVNVQDFHRDVPGRTNEDFFGDTFYGIFDDRYPTNAYGYLIETAPAGATRARLKSAFDARNFELGRWVLVMSYVQDSVGSYPPNMRYYDFAKVTAIDFESGVIGLDTPLRFSHLSARPYSRARLHAEPSIKGNGIGAGIVGPARIVNIDTAMKPITESFELSGIHFLANPRSPHVHRYSDGWEFTGTIDAKADDLIFDRSINTASMRSFTLTNSSAFFEEADKLVATARYVNVTITKALLHSGQLLWHATGGAYGGHGEGELSCAALECRLDGGTVLTAAERPSGPHTDMELDRVGFTEKLSLDGVVFRGSGARGNAAIGAWAGNPYEIGTPGFALQDGPNGSSTRLAVSKCVQDPIGCTDMEHWRTMAQNVTSDWSEGSVLVRDGVLVPEATITSITGDDRSIYVDVVGTTLAEGETVYFTRVNNLSVTNSTFEGIGNGCQPAEGPEGCIRYPRDRNIPVVVWTGNSGD